MHRKSIFAKISEIHFSIFICISQTAQDVVISKLNSPDLPILLAPFWHEDTHSLYFVNFFAIGNQSSIFCYNAIENVLYGAYIEGLSAPSFIIPIDHNNSGRCWECEKCTNCEKKCRNCYVPEKPLFTLELPNECNERFFVVGVGDDALIIQWNAKSTKAVVVTKLLSLKSDVPSHIVGGRTDPKVNIAPYIRYIYQIFFCFNFIQIPFNDC